VHGYLALRTLDGKTVAAGDLYQIARGDRVRARLVFRFRDGSLQEETAEFSQRKAFKLIRYHLVQKGPSFAQEMDVTIDVAKGDVSVRTVEKGEPKTYAEHLDLPDDLANGIVSTVMKNANPEAPETTLSLLVASPKPRVVKLHLVPMRQETFLVAGSPRKAVHYVIKIEIGGLAGVVAPLVGKDPPDAHLWVQYGEAPAFVKSEAPLAFGGPALRVELVGGGWPKESSPPKTP
jgi:hypothetical protein